MNGIPALVKQGGKIHFLISAGYENNQTHTKPTRTVPDKDKLYNVMSQTMEVCWKLVFPESWWIDYKMWRKTEKASKEGKGGFYNTTPCPANCILWGHFKSCNRQKSLSHFLVLHSTLPEICGFWWSWSIPGTTQKNFALALNLPVALP